MMTAAFFGFLNQTNKYVLEMGQSYPFTVLGQRLFCFFLPPLSHSSLQMN
jgi:hypothetical protein